MKSKILIFVAVLISLTIIWTIQAEPIHDYGNYSVKDNITISACISVNVDILYANITKPDNISKIMTLSCSGTGYCPQSWIYCIGIFTNSNVSGIYNVSFYSDRYELSTSFRGFFTVFEGTFLNVSYPLNNTIKNNRTIIIKGLTNGTNVSIIKGNVNFYVKVINETFTFPLNLTEGENKINVTSYGQYKYVNSTILKIILDTIPPEIKWINYSNSIRISREFKFALNVSDNINISSVSVKKIHNNEEINNAIYFENGFYVIPIQEYGIGDYLLKVKACDLAGNCNESSFSYYVYKEYEEEPKDKENLPSVNVTNETNETSISEFSLKIIGDEGNTIGVVNFNTTDKSFNATHLRFINGIIFYESESGGRKLLNGSVIIKFWNNNGRGWTKNETKFDVSNGKVEENIKEILEGVSEERKKELKRDENVGTIEPPINQPEKLKIKIPENLIKNENYETEVRDKDGNLIKNGIAEITLPNGEKIKVKTDEEGRVKLTMSNGKIEQIKEAKVKIPEKTNEWKVFELEVRDNDGNLIKNGIAEITLPNGEKIKVKTDEEGRVKLTMSNGKIEQIKETKVKIPEKIEDGKIYELEVRDENGELIKNKTVNIKLSNGQFLIAKTDENGKVKLEYKNGIFVVVRTQKQEFQLKWYYFLPLLLIPLILFFTLKKEDVILSYEFYKKLEKENNLKELQKYGKIYMLEKHKNDVKIKVIFVDEESEEKLIKKLKLKVLKIGQ